LRVDPWDTNICSYSGWWVTRVRGAPISDKEAREFARLLQNEGAVALTARLNRALEDEIGGLVATDRLEARAVLIEVRVGV
jgi:hypothetical protein